MKVYFYVFSILVMLCLFFIFFFCDDDDNMVDDFIIVEFVQDNDNFSIFVDVVIVVGLVDVLNDCSVILMLFVLINVVFVVFLDDNGFSSLNDVFVDLLCIVLLYYVFFIMEIFDKLESNYYNIFVEFDVNELLLLYVSIFGGVKINVDVDVIVVDEVVVNGVIYIVDVVIMLVNVVIFVVVNLNFSNLVVVLICIDLMINFVNIFFGDGLFMVFVLINVVFEVLLVLNNEWNFLDDILVEILEIVLSYYVVVGVNVCVGDIVDDVLVMSFEGLIFFIDLDGDMLMINVGFNIVNIVVMDVQGINGVVYVIDVVILF